MAFALTRIEVANVEKRADIIQEIHLRALQYLGISWILEINRRGNSNSSYKYIYIVVST